MDGWDVGDPGVVVLPSGRLVRGRASRLPRPDGAAPDFGLYLAARRPDPLPWPSRWLRWPDFCLPVDRLDADAALRQLWERSAGQRVEVACGHGRGRTGTALACLAVLDGVPADDAVAWTRSRYDRRAAETPWQRRYVERLGVR
ncbi:protein-tyrosine phosphatase family protein [Pseudokineococcus marinus]|uniref:Protein phosphatase n=1 Tax=Pseudokineococcus marinus TaxID=351215 RepID=A0A849BK56_9ACTN|nr:protein phosphatase [Pseudokineococcus marinus]